MRCQRGRKWIRKKFKFNRSTTSFYFFSPTSHFIPNMEGGRSIKIFFCFIYMSESDSREVLLALEWSNCIAVAISQGALSQEKYWQHLLGPLFVNSSFLSHQFQSLSTRSAEQIISESMNKIANSSRLHQPFIRVAWRRAEFIDNYWDNLAKIFSLRQNAKLLLYSRWKFQELLSLKIKFLVSGKLSYLTEDFKTARGFECWITKFRLRRKFSQNTSEFNLFCCCDSFSTKDLDHCSKKLFNQTSLSSFQFR